MKAFTILSVLALAATTVNAWGSEGHRAVASVAYSQLNPTAKAAVDNIVSNQNEYQDFLDAATWPDQIRSQRPDTAPLHFVDYEDDPTNGQCGNAVSQNGLPTTCNSPGCVVTAINGYAQQLASSDPTSSNAAEALAFVTHFVGDVAQPLHASGYQKGGNGIKVVWDNSRRANLHAIWDTQMPVENENAQGGFDSWVGNLQTLVPASQTLADCAASANVANGDMTSCAQSWAADSQALACSVAYGSSSFSTSSNLDDPNGYYGDASPVIDQQISKAGQRLAALLNNILGGSGKKMAKREVPRARGPARLAAQRQ